MLIRIAWTRMRKLDLHRKRMTNYIIISPLWHLRYVILKPSLSQWYAAVGWSSLAQIRNVRCLPRRKGHLCHDDVLWDGGPPRRSREGCRVMLPPTGHKSMRFCSEKTICDPTLQNESRWYFSWNFRFYMLVNRHSFSFQISGWLDSKHQLTN